MDNSLRKKMTFYTSHYFIVTKAQELVTLQLNDTNRDFKDVHQDRQRGVKPAWCKIRKQRLRDWPGYTPGMKRNGISGLFKKFKKKL